MQDTGHVKINGEIVKVLVRSRKYGRSLKRRKSGKVGREFTAESQHLNDPECSDLLNKLMNFETVNV